MRLWHQSLLKYLDNRRLLGQHRECCALRGKGWKKKHSVVDYVFKYGLDHLFEYHKIVMEEMASRGFQVDGKWMMRTYRGKNVESSSLTEIGLFDYCLEVANGRRKITTNILGFKEPLPIYPEHDDWYLKDCLLNLKAKEASLVNGGSIESFLIRINLASENGV